MAVSYGAVFATALDATGGVLSLEVPQPGVAYAPVVDLLETPDLLADALDLPWTRSFRHGFCWGLLVPDGSRLLVVVMGREGPDLDADGVVAGRLSEEDTRRWGPLWQGRAVRVSVLVEATPGLFGLEVRFLTRAPQERTPAVVEAAAPVVDAETPEEVTGSTEEDVATPLGQLVAAGIESQMEAATQPEPYAGPGPAATVVEPAVDDSAAEPASPEIGLVVAYAVDEPDVADVAAVDAVDAATLEDAVATEDVAPVEDAVAVDAVESVAAAEDITAVDAVEALDAADVDAAPAEETPPAEEAPLAVDLAALMPPGAPAAWYVDPYDASALRWWDGTRWTTDAAPRPAPGNDAGPG